MNTGYSVLWCTERDCRRQSGQLHLLFEVEHGAQCDVDLHEFFRVQAACEGAEALRVNGGGLLDQYPDVLAEQLDGGWIMDPKDVNSYLASPFNRQTPLKNAACWNGLEAVYIFLTVGAIDVTKPRSYVPFG